MSRKKGFGRSLFDILRSLGARIERADEEAVIQEREATTLATQDIVIRNGLASPDVVEQAVKIAKDEGSMELYADRVTEAKVSMLGAEEASRTLTEVAASIAAKK